MSLEEAECMPRVQPASRVGGGLSVSSMILKQGDRAEIVIEPRNGLAETGRRWLKVESHGSRTEAVIKTELQRLVQCILARWKMRNDQVLRN
jgi:hypothetical protein